jgi:glyoxylase-like metal-dependent hydrolase (beta-lactamase superfamily II)
MPHEPLIFGSFEIVPLCDGWTALPLAEEVPGQNIDWDAERRRYPWAFPPDGGEGWAWHVHAFLLRSPDELVLVDTGIGHLGQPRYEVTGRIDDELRAVGVAHDDVDHIVYTHLHADHSEARVVPTARPGSRTPAIMCIPMIGRSSESAAPRRASRVASRWPRSTSSGCWTSIPSTAKSPRAFAWRTRPATRRGTAS